MANAASVLAIRENIYVRTLRRGALKSVLLYGEILGSWWWGYEFRATASTFTTTGVPPSILYASVSQPLQ